MWISELKTALQSINDTGLLEGKDMGKITWEDIIDAMDSARTSYISKGERNMARRVLRHGAALEVVFEPLLGLIPDQYGLNIIRGGLVVLFKVIAAVISTT
jgi:hypothetical protein